MRIYSPCVKGCTHTHTHTHTHIYIYIYIYIYYNSGWLSLSYLVGLCKTKAVKFGECSNFHHTSCESTSDTLPSSAANQSDNTVSVAQGSTATPGATKQLLPPDRVLKELYIYIYIYTPDQSLAETTLDVHLHS